MEAVPMVEAVPASSRFKRMTDEQIVEKCKNGDTTATEYLLRKYKSVVLFKSNSYFLPGADRDDMIQEGMIGLFKAIRDFRPDRSASFKTFADTCITRQMITAVKRGTGKKQQPHTQTKVFSFSDILPPDRDDGNDDDYIIHRKPPAWMIDPNSPEKLLIASERVQELHVILKEKLSKFEWNVFVGFNEGKSYQEIADEQGCKPKSVDNALTRVRRKMKKFRVEQGQAGFETATST